MNAVSRIVASLATTVESFVSNETVCVGSCVRLMLTHTMADKFLSSFFRGVVYNASTTAIVVVVVYLLICILYAPLYVVAFVITGWGSLLLLLGGIALLLRWFSRSMTFAGSNPSLQRDYSVDYMKRYLTQIEHTAVFVSQYAATLLLLVNNKLPSNDIAGLKSKTKRLEGALAGLNEIVRSIDAAAQISSQSHCYGGILPNEAAEIQMLKTNLSNVTKLIQELTPHIEPTITVHMTLTPPHAASGAISPSKQSSLSNASTSSTVLLLGSRLLGATEDLKKCAIALRPVGKQDNAAQQQQPTHSQDDATSGFNAILSQLTSMHVGPTGIEKLAFPLMRVRLREDAVLEDETMLYGADGNKIDCVYVPSRHRRGAVKQQQFVASHHTHPHGGGHTHHQSSTISPSESASTSLPSSSSSVSEVGTVLFCPPNCGFFECLSQMPAHSNWLSFYTNLGFDVCLFNYRGYVQSEGVPTPDRLKSDAEVVVRYLRTRKHVKRLVIHGESVGGMVACHVAHVCGCELLVCDRTFTSLDAIGERMLGYWAKLGMRIIGQWRTDVSADYLGVCGTPKVILQDPKDEVISNTASLKNGVATRLVFGDRHWDIATLSRPYRVAEALGTFVPSHMHAPASFTDGRSPQERYNAYVLSHAHQNRGGKLSELLCMHLFAHIVVANWRAMTACAARIKHHRARAQHSYAQQHQHQQQQQNNPSSHPRRLTRSNSNNSDNSKINGAGITLTHVHTRSSSAESEESDYEDIILDAGGADSEDDDGKRGNDADVEEGGGELYDSFTTHSTGHTYQDSDHVPIIATANEDEDIRKYTTMAERKEAYLLLLKASVDDASLSFAERMWLIVSRIDGFTGQLLVDSFLQHYDGFRAWVASYIVWTNRSSACRSSSNTTTSATSTTGNGITMHQAILLLTELLESSPMPSTTFTHHRASPRSSSSSSASHDDHYNNTNNNKQTLRFIRDALQIIETMRVEMSKGDAAVVCTRAGLHSHIWPQQLQQSNIRGGGFQSYLTCPPTAACCCWNSQQDEYFPISSPPNGVNTVANPVEQAPLSRGTSGGSSGTNSSFELIDVTFQSTNNPASASASSHHQQAHSKAPPPIAAPEPTPEQPTVSFASKTVQDTSVGYIIPLATGHNGWPKDAQLEQLTQVIRVAGFLNPV